MHLYLLLTLLATFLPLIVVAADSSNGCKSTAQCVCSPSQGGQEYWCLHLNKTNRQVIVDVTPSNPHRYSMSIKCSFFNEDNRDYFHVVKELNITKKIDSLTIIGCPLPTVPFHRFVDPSNFAHLKQICFDNGLQVEAQLKSSYFEKLISVEKLYFRDSNLTVLPDNVFEQLPNLKRLYLNGNALTSVSAQLLQHVPKLERIDLGSNKIRELDPQLFNSLPNLQLLNLFLNPLGALDGGLFDRLDKLVSLDLHGTNLRALDVNQFGGVLLLEELNLSFNNFTSLPAGLFERNKALKRVRLRSVAGSADFVLPTALLRNLTSLVEVDLEANNFTALPEDLFEGDVKLEAVNLRYNILRELPDSVFRDLQSLKTLDLSHNRLEDISR